MKFYSKVIGLLFGLAMLAGCASTQVTQQTPLTAPGLARPNQIWVYDFVAASSDMPADSSLAGQVGAPSTPPTPEEIETGRKYGAMIAQQLVIDIQGMGMPAIEAGPGSSPQIGDGVIRGYIVSTEGGGAGNMVKRMVIGFGAGTAEMDTVVEGYVMTPQGLRKLGSGTLDFVGKQIAWLNRTRRSGHSRRESGGSDRSWRREDLWRSERQDGAGRSRKVNRRRDCGSTQDQISGPRLDCSRLNGFGESGRTACTARTVSEPTAHAQDRIARTRSEVHKAHRPAQLHAREKGSGLGVLSDSANSLELERSAGL